MAHAVLFGRIELGHLHHDQTGITKLHIGNAVCRVPICEVECRYNGKSPKFGTRCGVKFGTIYCPRLLGANTCMVSRKQN